MNNEELIAAVRNYDWECSGDTRSRKLLNELADALEAATADVEWEYGKKRRYIDGWERGDRLDDNHYVTQIINKEQQPDMRRRKAGKWEVMQ